MLKLLISSTLTLICLSSSISSLSVLLWERFFFVDTSGAHLKALFEINISVAFKLRDCQCYCHNHMDRNSWDNTHVRKECIEFFLYSCIDTSISEVYVCCCAILIQKNLFAKIYLSLERRERSSSFKQQVAC